MQRDRARERDDALASGAFATLKPQIAGELWRLRERCEEADDADHDAAIELWTAYEARLLEEFGERPTRRAIQHEVMDALVRERNVKPSVLAPVITSTDARRLARLAHSVSDDARIDFVAGSIMTARVRAGALAIVGARRRHALDVTLGFAVPRSAPRILVGKTSSFLSLSVMGKSSPDAFHAAFVVDVSPRSVELDGALAAGMLKLSWLDAAPRLRMLDGICALRWTHATHEPLEPALAITNALLARYGSRTDAAAPRPPRRRRRRWPPPAR